MSWAQLFSLLALFPLCLNVGAGGSIRVGLSPCVCKGRSKSCHRCVLSILLTLSLRCEEPCQWAGASRFVRGWLSGQGKLALLPLAGKIWGDCACRRACPSASLHFIGRKWLSLSQQSCCCCLPSFPRGEGLSRASCQQLCFLWLGALEHKYP